MNMQRFAIRFFSVEKFSYHKRTLPSSLIALSSKEGKQLFREALQGDGMESFFPLSEQFVTQSEPSFCSLSSLAMVLNALSFDPKRIWKGAWRWVSEEMLQCESAEVCGHSIERIKKEGMNFDEFAALAKCHGVTIQSYRASKIENEYHLFKDKVIEVSQNSNANQFIIVNFSRKYLGQTGIGHFSPIGGYHAASDLALVLDVARFKYPPYWVPLKQLWESMGEEDIHSSESRGYFVVSSASSNGIDTSNNSNLCCVHKHCHIDHKH
jgi:glutathione gamma-glutamylcysteinyltransferase